MTNFKIILKTKYQNIVCKKISTPKLNVLNVENPAPLFEYIEIDYNRNRRHSANEFVSPVKFEATSLYTARWISCDDPLKLKKFIDSNQMSIATDHDGDPVFMARNAWHLSDAQDKNKDIKFKATK